MASKIADAFVEIGAKTSKFEKGMSGVRKRLGRIGSGFKSLAKTASIAFLAIGAAVTLLGKTFIDAASSMENYEVRLETLLGSQKKATQAMKLFSKIAGDVHFALDDIAEAGVTLEAMGAKHKKWLPVLADVAAFMGIDMKNAAMALGRAYAAGSGAADIFREKGILNIIRDSKGINDLTKLTLPQFREAMFEAFTDPQGKIAGGAKKMAGTWTGQLSMLGDAIFKLKKEFGEALLPAMKELVTFTIKPLVTEWVDWVKANKDLVKEDIAFHVHNMKVAIELLGDAIRFVSKNYAEFRASFILLSLDMRKAWIDFVMGLKVIWESTMGFLSKKWLLFSTDGISAMGKIKIAILDLQKDFSNLAASVIKNWNEIRFALMPVLKVLELIGLNTEVSQKKLDNWAKGFTGAAEIAKKKIAGISPEFAKLSDAQDKATAKRINNIIKEGEKQKAEFESIREAFLKSERERIKKSLSVTKDMGKNEEDFTKKVQDENKKRSVSFVGLTDILKKIQETALGKDKKSPLTKIATATTKPQEQFVGAISGKEIKNQTNVVKDSNVILKEMNDTLKTRTFVPQASMG